MDGIVLVNKPVGMTPYDIVRQFKLDYPEYSECKVGYAGRLDPMASGLLLLMVGKENKKRVIHLKHKKEYLSQILFGVATDSYDILGMINKVSAADIDKNKVESIIYGLKGEIIQSPPPYSSYRINGKPLFYYAREGKLPSTHAPLIKREVNDIEIVSWITLHKKKLEEYILKRIKLVKGDFRQEIVIQSWVDFFKKNKQELFTVCNVVWNVSSGTYIRSLNFNVGQESHIPSLTLSLERRLIGEYKI